MSPFCKTWKKSLCITSDLNRQVSAIWTTMLENVPSDRCAQRRFRSACAFAQSDQNLHWAHFGKPRMQSFFMRSAKTLIRLCIRAVWFECTLSTHFSRYVFWRRGLNTPFIIGSRRNGGNKTPAYYSNNGTKLLDIFNQCLMTSVFIHGWVRRHLHGRTNICFYLYGSWGQGFSLSITKTRLYNFDPHKPHFYIIKLGFTGVYIIFLISARNIDCGYSLEPPRRGGSNEYPQSIFWAEIRKLLAFFNWKFPFFGL